MKHGEFANYSRPSAEYGIWSSMKDRCNRKSAKAYPYYGGRGIKVCERWESYDLFLLDMGRRPTKSHSIDRIDNNGDYEPANCRWATKKEQACNRRNAVRINGMTREEIAEATGLKYSSVASRELRGWDAEKTLSTQKLARSVRSTNVIIEARGESLPVAEWARRIGISKSSLHRRLERGLTGEDAIRPASPARGQSISMAKLDEDKVRVIRFTDRTARELADEFGITMACVYAIRKMKTWRHVT